MVGEEGVTDINEYNDLSESKGQLVPLNSKNNFGYDPHLRKSKVYFIRSSDAIKIGVSINPEQRFGELQVGSALELELLGVMDGTKETEKEIHARFDALHIRGEWFHADKSLLGFIQATARDPELARLLPPPAPRHIQYRPERKPNPPLSEEARTAIVRMIKMRTAYGANTPMGHTCSNLAEQIENMASYVRPDWATDERQTLPYMIKQQMKRIEAGRQ